MAAPAAFSDIAKAANDVRLIPLVELLFFWEFLQFRFPTYIQIRGYEEANRNHHSS